MVSVYEPDDVQGTIVYTFVPKSTQGERKPHGIPQRIPQFIVALHQEPDGPVLEWAQTSDDPGNAREEIEADVAARIQDRMNWMARITSLVDPVEGWARELGWSVRRIEKTLDDYRIGKHRVPSLLMQEGTCRVLLEPVGSSAPGTEGVADLYLMPAYDDIATFYYYESRWNLHYAPRETQLAITSRDAKGMPLAKETLRAVLEELTRHAT
jgi:hypothetical protein